MRRFLLILALLTTITLSSSNVLPILSIKKLDTEPLIANQDNDNTFNKKHIHINPNIFYRVFIETPKDNSPKTTKLKFMENDDQDAKILNGKTENDDKYDDKGFRKEQWHNYPRQLDRLNRNYNVHTESDNSLLDTTDLERLKGIQNVRAQYISNDGGTFDADAIDQPLLILKIRLSYLNDNINNADLNSFQYTDLLPVESNTYDETANLGNESLLNKDSIASIIKVKRKTNPRLQNIAYLENSSNDNKSVGKRIFSFWSRLQGLSHRGHELHHRRHLYALYGLPEDGGGVLTAETRAMMRPPGSPLRWG